MAKWEYLTTGYDDGYWVIYVRQSDAQALLEHVNATVPGLKSKIGGGMILIKRYGGGLELANDLRNILGEMGWEMVHLDIFKRPREG